MKNPLLTVITATLNCESLLKDTLNSALEQGFKNMEYIVADGLSRDRTVEIIKDYQQQFLKKGLRFQWISEKDNGIYDALNKGIHMAKGQYIIFMGAGDYFFPEILNKMEKILATGKYDLIYGNVYDKAQNVAHRGKYDIKKILVWSLNHQASFYKKELFEKYGYYSLKYKYNSDYLFELKCFSPQNKISIKYVKNIISVFEGQGVSAFQIDNNFVKDLPEIIKGNFGEEGLQYHKNEMMKRDKKTIAESVEELIKRGKIHKNDQFIIYGTANWGQKFYEVLIEKDMDVIAFSDSNQEKWGLKFNNVEVIPPETIRNTSYNKILIASSKRSEIRDKLMEMGYEDKQIIFLQMI